MEVGLVSYGGIFSQMSGNGDTTGGALKRAVEK
jgi:hypothetical protein